MSAYYSFDHPLLSTAAMDVTHRVPDAQFEPTLVQDMRTQLSEPRRPATPCCTQPQPCHTWVQWKPELSECPTTYVSWRDATNNQVKGFEVGQKDSRIWVASLDDLQYRRSLVSGAEWWAPSTQGHIRNRQLFAQYLQSSYYKPSSPDLKRIGNVGESYGVLLHRYGRPQYTSF